MCVPSNNNPSPLRGDPTLKKNKELFYIDKSDLFQTTKTKLENMKCHSELQVRTPIYANSFLSGNRWFNQSSIICLMSCN